MSPENCSTLSQRKDHLPYGTLPLSSFTSNLPVIFFFIVVKRLKIYPLNKFWVYTLTAAAKSLQSCPTLCDPIDGSPPGSPIPEILQARILEWVAISFSNAWKWKVKWSRSVVSDSLWPHGVQPTRLLCPWDFPGKSTGVGCHCLLQYTLTIGTIFYSRSLELVHLVWKVKVAQSCPTLCDPMDYTVHATLQDRNWSG